MANCVSLRQLLAAAATVGALAILTLPGGATQRGAVTVNASASAPFCRLYLDPHDKFTRVVAPKSSRAALRSSATLSTVFVNQTGFTSEALEALEVAIDIWQTQVSSTVPVVIDAEFTDLGNPNLLGDARFRSLSFNFPGAPLAYVLFPGPIANRLSGVDRDGAQSEIVIRLNSGANWNFATDGVPVAGKADFVSAVMHEMGHGFGHCGSATVSNTTGLGSWGYMGLPYVYDVAVVDSAGFFLLNHYPNGSAALAAALRGTGTSGPGLFWTGSHAVAANGGVRPKLYTPPTFTLGSSYNHLDDAAFPAGDLNSLMTPTLGTAEVIQTPGGILNGMFADMGWGLRCSFGLSQSLATVSGGGGTVSVTLSTSTGCPWTATTGASFATITEGASGSTSAVVRVSLSANTAMTPRVATVQIADQTLTIAQPGTTPCAYALTPGSATMAGTGGSGNVAVQTIPGCAWAAHANPSEATFTSAASGVGSATVAYNVAANPTCAARTVTLTIAGQPFVITQAAAPPAMSLDTTSLRFGAVSSGASFSSSTSAQTVRIAQNGTGTVTWTAMSSAPWLVVSPTSGTGPATLSISTQYAAALAVSQSATVTVVYSGAATAASTITATLGVIPTQSASPFGAFDTPITGATGVVGSVPVTGWALDDVEVSRVRIMRDPVEGEPAGTLVYVGDADLVQGARPDVQALYTGMPRSGRAGWGYLMLTNFLPGGGNGTFRLTAIAEDADGHTTVLGTKTITCTNATATAPFGAIDTPAQGGTASGTLLNYGWVLSPAPRRADPPGGGTVQVVIDGAFVTAVPAGWTSRSDLAALFPADQYPGIPSALGVAAIDTTVLANGVHTIAWVVTDNLNTASGVGSRYFTVANEANAASSGTCTLPATLRTDRQISLASTVRRSQPAPQTLSWRRGYDRGAPFQVIEPGLDGRFTIQSEEIDRIELQLEAGATGHLRVAGELQALPVGAQIDPATGAFTWQPGVGFVGTYDFLLGGREVRIVLNAKGSDRVGPQVAIDLPSAGAREVGRSFVVAGWAADLDSTIDGGVDAVHVWAYPADGSAPIFIGSATYGGARPDVAGIYGERFGKSGYGIEVKDLAPGSYDIAVFAYSTVKSGFAPAKTVRVTVR